MGDPRLRATKRLRYLLPKWNHVRSSLRGRQWVRYLRCRPTKLQRVPRNLDGRHCQAVSMDLYNHHELSQHQRRCCSCTMRVSSYISLLPRALDNSTSLHPHSTLTLPHSGGTDGTTCGEHWTSKSVYDGSSGVGQQMSALSVIQCTLLNFAPALVTNLTGGTSQGNPAAGTSSQDSADPTAILPPTNADRAGAGILTALLLVFTVGGVGFMVTGI